MGCPHPRPQGLEGPLTKPVRLPKVTREPTGKVCFYPDFVQDIYQPTGLTAKVLDIMARLAGFEPATHGLEVRCSVQLSYRRSGLRLKKVLVNLQVNIESKFLPAKSLSPFLLTVFAL